MWTNFVVIVFKYFEYCCHLFYTMYSDIKKNERVHMNILRPLPVTKAESKYMLMVIDCYTKWLECFPNATQTAVIVARAQEDHFSTRVGCPIELHTDP